MDKKPPARWSLQAILFGQLGLAALLPLLAVAAFIMVWVGPQLHDDLEAQQGAQAGTMAGQIETHLLGAERELASLAAVVAAGARSPRELDQLFDAVVRSGELYEAVYLLGPELKVSGLGLPVARRQARDDLRVVDGSRREFVRTALAEQTAVWSPTSLSAVSGRLTVAVALPAGSGVLVGELALGQVSSFLRKLRDATGSLALVVDPFGRVIAHPDPSYDGRQISLAGLDPVRNAFASGAALGHATLDGEPLVGAALKIRQTSWAVFVGQPEAVVYRSIDVIRLAMLVGLLFALGLATVAAALAARSMAGKFAHYTGNVAALARGRYELGWPSTRVREFAALAADLQHTADAIRQREAALKASEQKFLSLFHASPVPVAVSRLDARVSFLDCNTAWERLFGWERAAIAGKTGLELDLWPQVAQREALLLALGARGEVSELEVELRRRDGRIVTCLISARPLAVDGERLFVLAYQDVSDERTTQLEIRRLNASLEERVASRTAALAQANQELQRTLDTLQFAQQELVRSEKLAALGALVAGVAHELNTPIGNSLMAASTLDEHAGSFRALLAAGALKRSSLDQYVHDSVTATDIILRNLQKASELVSSFKQVAVDQTSAQRRHFTLQEVVSEILLTLRPSFRHSPFEVSAEIPDGIRLDSYPGPLGQVLSNLINNALVHGFEGRDHGSVRLSAVLGAAGEVRLEVADDGVGIPGRNLPRIFDPFYTTRLGKGGSGLGLHIAHNIVNRVLGGRIGVESSSAGSTFWLEIPLVAPVDVSETPGATSG